MSVNYEISNEYIKVKIAAIGAELQSVLKDGTEYLWDGDPKYWTEGALSEISNYPRKFLESADFKGFQKDFLG